MRIIPATMLALALSLSLVTSATAASIRGSWSGRGTVTLIPSGHVEPVSCRVNYEKGDDRGRTSVLHATCASTAGTFVQTGRVVKLSSSKYTGRLYSGFYDVEGEVSISVRGTRQTVIVTSSKGKGKFNLRKRKAWVRPGSAQ